MTGECLKMSKKGSLLVGGAEKDNHSCENDLGGNIQGGHKHDKVRSVTAKKAQYSYQMIEPVLSLNPCRPTQVMLEPSGPQVFMQDLSHTTKHQLPEKIVQYVRTEQM